MCGCLSHILYWEPGLQPRHVPWLGIELATLWFPGPHAIHRATPARARIKIILKVYLAKWQSWKRVEGKILNDSFWKTFFFFKAGPHAWWLVLWLPDLYGENEPSVGWLRGILVGYSVLESCHISLDGPQDLCTRNELAFYLLKSLWFGNSVIHIGT